MTDELSIPIGGKSVKLTGPMLIFVVGIISFGIFAGWLLWDTVKANQATTMAWALEKHEQTTASEHQKIEDAIGEQTDMQREQMQKQVDQLEFQNYMLFLADEKEKEKIKKRMRKPKLLRDLDRH